MNVRWKQVGLLVLTVCAVTAQVPVPARELQGVAAPVAYPSCLETVLLEPLNLHRALAAAFRDNPRIVSATGDLAMARGNEESATAAFEPQITASFQGERFLNEAPGNNPVTTVGSTVVGGQQDQYTSYPSVGANWNLYNGGRDLAAYRAAEASARASSADLSTQFNDTFTKVLTAYNDLMKAQARFEQQSNALEIHAAMVARTQLRFEHHHGTLIALDQARIARTETAREASKACRTVLDKSAALAQAIGIRLPSRYALSITAPLPVLPAIDFDQTAIEALIQRDPAVAAARSRVVAARHKFDQAHGALYPTLALVARYDWLGQKPESFSYAWHDTRPNSYFVGLVLQQTLFPVSTYEGGVDAAQGDVVKAQAAYDDAVISAETALRDALNAKQESDADAASGIRSAEEARQALILSKDLYARGQADLDTVDHARLDAGQEEEAAEEARADQVLNDWLAYRALHPNDFAPAILHAARKPADGH